MDFDNSDDRGALWARKTKAGQTYFTGVVNDERVVCWFNTKATPENRQPTFWVKKDKPRDEAQGQGSAPADIDDSIPF